MGSDVAVVEVLAGSERFDAVVHLADAILDRRRQIVSAIQTASESRVLGAFDRERCVGFQRFYVQVVGPEEGRPAVIRDGSPLTEGFVEAFGAHPADRVSALACSGGRRSCVDALGGHQVRSRSPVPGIENVAMKPEAGYVLRPSDENDSHHFLKKL